jgi:hypothetical protein
LVPRYKNAATISQKVLEEVSKWLVDGEKIIDLCTKGDKLLDDELGKGASNKAIETLMTRPSDCTPGWRS